MGNKYINIVKGEEIEMSDEIYAQSYIGFKQFKSDFFNDRFFKLVNINYMKNNTTEFDLLYNETLFHCVYLNIKNSGMNINERDRYIKRMQISNNFKSYNDNAPHFVIGSYNAGDKVLYYVVELKEYIKNKQGDKSYSSLWIDYGNICDTYEKGFNRVIDRNERVFVGIDNNRIKNFEDEEIIDKIFLSKDYYEETRTIKSKKEIFEENDNTTYVEGKKLKRNNELRKYAFERENYTCELCGTQNTFETNNGTEYFEGHHLIMYNLNSQSKYKYSLDVVENIICLCPNCHRKIHFADRQTIEDCVTKLLQKHMDLYDIFEFDEIEKVLENYNNYERDDDNE